MTVIRAPGGTADPARRHPNLRPGGKSLSKDGTISPVVRVVVSKVTRDKVKAAAAADGVSVSKWLRRTIEETLAAQGQASPPPFTEGDR
ncbi:MAG: hypothetical protein FWD75_06550 [Propionibacteriaceae bacterium]|nr:hypothetical protein [Propionibacteriaceae bacterium]